MRERLHCAVLVVGGGPAGLAAATRAAECGRTVVLVDDNPSLGGQIWRTGTSKELGGRSSLAVHWMQRLQASSVAVLAGFRIVQQSGPDRLIAESDTGVCEIQYQSLVLATGARELFLPFPGWTLPNVMGAGALQAMVKAGLPIAGKRVVIAGSGPLLLAVAVFLRQHGAKVAASLEQSSRGKVLSFLPALLARPRTLMQGLGYRLRLRGIRYKNGWWPVAAAGESRVEHVTVTNGRVQEEIACDYLACGFHLVPNLELPSLLQCEIERGRVIVDEWQRTSIPGIYCAGEPTGIGGLELALLEGEIAGLTAARSADKAVALQRRRRHLQAFKGQLAKAFRLRPELTQLPREETIVCRCEDVRFGSLQEHASWRAAKLHTRCGMGPCQGRICGPAVEFLLGWKQDSIRPPLYPVRVATMAAAIEADEPE
jgi:D-hydroxyproline dehydrogenase subunit alpha